MKPNESHRESEGTKQFVLDLHGHPTEEAVSLADKIVREAGSSGYESVKLIHGAPDVKDRHQADVGRRGRIKCELRDRLAGDEWGKFADPLDSEIQEGAMTLALKPNAAANDVGLSAARLPKPKKSSYFKARRNWNSELKRVEEEFPILATAKERCPDLVAKCLRAITEERVRGGRLEHKRAENPDYSSSRTYERLLRRWEKSRTKARQKLDELQSVASGS
jgi:hypothetical protein